MPLLLQDVHHGLRSLFSTPAFLGLAVLCLGFGIGASTWAFSIVNRLALQPAPFPSAHQMVALYEYREVNPAQSLPASYPNFLDWRDALESSGELAALKPRFLVLRGDFEPERIAAAEITPNLFEVLGVHPLLGRHFRDDEAGTGGAGDVVLLGDASLFVRSFTNLLQSDGELETESLLVLSIQLPEEPYAAPDRAVARVDDLLDRMRSSPSVTAAAASAMLPLRFASGRATAWPGDTATDDGSPGLSVRFAPVTADFFAALNLPLEQGASWTEADATSPVAVINRTLAQRFWGNGSVVGEWLRLSGGGVDLQLNVVGVAPDLANWDQSNRPLPTVFLPHPLAPVLNLHLLARVDGSPASAAMPIRTAILAADPDISWLIAGASAVIAAAGIVATLVPARRAAQVDAAALLREA